MWLFKQPKRIHFYKKRQTKTAQKILERLRTYLDNEAAEPIKILCGFWQNQQDAIAYQELRVLVEQGYLDDVTAQLWQQDYSALVMERMPKIWRDAMIAGSISQPIMEKALSAFTFNTQTPGVVEWIRSRGAFLVTSSAQTQKDAIALLLEDKIREKHTVDELARLIRPTIGLYKQQASAVEKYFSHMVESLTKDHPRTKPDVIRRRALTQATKYAERLHRQRAMTIAQTEMAFAYNFGADEGIRQAQADFLIGKCEKKWCTSGDENVCEECERLDGVVIGMEELFFSGNRVEYEESGLYPPLHPRCACAVEYIETEEPPQPVAKRDEDGSPITESPKEPTATRYGAEDVTQEWLDDATPYSHATEDVYQFVQDGVKYTVDGMAVIFDPSPSERNIAEVLRSSLGGEILLMPRVNSPEGVKVADYLFRGRRFDLKEITTPGRNVIYNRIKGSIKQSDNFVIDVTGNPLGFNNLDRQTAQAFTSKNLKKLKTVILVDDGKIKRILRRA